MYGAVQGNNLIFLKRLMDEIHNIHKEPLIDEFHVMIKMAIDKNNFEIFGYLTSLSKISYDDELINYSLIYTLRTKKQSLY